MARTRHGPRRIAAADARQNFSQLIGDVRTAEEPVIIEKGGVPVAAIVPLAVLERERRWMEERGERLALLERLRRPFRDVSAEDIGRKATEAIADVRRPRRRRTPR